MESLYAQHMKERFGRGVVERPFGYVTYRIEGEMCSAIDWFIRKEDRGQQSWKLLRDDLWALCRERGVKTVIGFVDTNLPGATARLKAYFRHGAQIREVLDKVIVIEWEV